MVRHNFWKEEAEFHKRRATSAAIKASHWFMCTFLLGMFLLVILLGWAFKPNNFLKVELRAKSRRSFSTTGTGGNPATIGILGRRICTVRRVGWRLKRTVELQQKPQP
jgi:hypothetical protein